MASENKSHQATPRRRQKAREQGRVPRSRELGPALATIAVVFLVGWQMARGIGQWKAAFRVLLGGSPDGILSPVAGFVTLNKIATFWLYPAMMGAFFIAIAAGAAQGGFVFAPTLLQPQWSRISPVSKLQQLFSLTSVANFAKALAPTAVIAYLVIFTLTRDWASLCGSASLHTRSLAVLSGSRLFEAAWKSSLVLVCWSAADFFFERMKFERDLKMTHQEVKEESKESEGNPQIKARIRKLQRQTRRKRMLEDVAKASVVITNPTHYAIALEYNERLCAPLVVAKGRNLLAQQIKEVARWNNVPTIENVPLAHALYRGADVGQIIPAKLYAAVAEVLAYIMRAQARATKGVR